MKKQPIKRKNKIPPAYIDRESLICALRIAINANQRYGLRFTGETLSWHQVLTDLTIGNNVKIR